MSAITWVTFLIIYGIVMVVLLWAFRRKEDISEDETLGDETEMIEVEISGESMPIRKKELAFWEGLTRSQKRKMMAEWKKNVEKKVVSATEVRGKRVYTRKIPLK
jgi:hypothetical protein